MAYLCSAHELERDAVSLCNPATVRPRFFFATSSVLVSDPDVVLLRDIWTNVDGLPHCDVYMQVQPKGLPNATEVRARGGQFYDSDYPHHYNTGVFAMRACAVVKGVQ